MDNGLLQKLKEWRKNAAQNEGVELFRVLSNEAIRGIAKVKPRNKDELLAIKGFKEKKVRTYGRASLDLINGSDGGSDFFSASAPEKTTGTPFSVSDYLDILNKDLGTKHARIQGEINSVDVRERVIYFSLKDSHVEGVINCLMWQSDYRMNGVSFEIGAEVILEGYPDIYKPSGRLSFKASSAERVGEGALKKAYDELKKKLEREGIFSPERKKAIPPFPQKIGLITSRTGAVIHDFESNLGKYGYRIKFFDSRVEGQAAVRDLISALNYFKRTDIDALVVIRGGGSYESLQAFNNEALVRAIANMDMPVICGIGHDKDVPLASLAADLMVSTPTAATTALNKSWDGALHEIEIFHRDLTDNFQRALSNKKSRLQDLVEGVRDRLNLIVGRCELLHATFREKVSILGHAFQYTRRALQSYQDSLRADFTKHIQQSFHVLETAERRLVSADPRRQLRLGYSIVSIGGKIVKSARQAKPDSELEIQVSDGRIKSRVIKIIT